MQQVCAKQREHGPAFGVPGLDVRVQLNASPRRREAESEFHVLDAGPGESSVEAAVLKKYGPADRSTARPESDGAAARILMNEVMQQVAIVAGERAAPGLVVVGAEHCIELRVCRKCRPQTVERIWMDLNIRIQEEQDVTGCGPRAEVSRRRRPGLRLPQQRRTVGAGQTRNLAGVRGRGPIVGPP